MIVVHNRGIQKIYKNPNITNTKITLEESSVSKPLMIANYRQQFCHFRQPKIKNHKSAMCYNLFGNVSHAKTHPGILNIIKSVSICIAAQSFDILKFSVCHSLYNVC